MDRHRALLQDGIELEPIKAVSNDGDLYPYDGYHRIEAHLIEGVDQIKVESVNGSLEYAQHLAAAANSKTSLKRDTETVRRSIHHCLVAEATKSWSDSAIARHVGTSRSTVLRWRNHLLEQGEVAQRETVTAVRGGETITMPAQPQNVKRSLQSSTVDPDICRWTEEQPNFAAFTKAQNAAWLDWIIEEYETFGLVERAPFKNEPNAFVVKWLEDGQLKRARFSGLKVAYRRWQSKFFDYPQRPDISKPEPTEEQWPSPSAAIQAVPSVPEVVGPAAIAHGPQCSDLLESLINRFGAEDVAAALVEQVGFMELMDIIGEQQRAAIAS